MEGEMWREKVGTNWQMGAEEAQSSDNDKCRNEKSSSHHPPRPPPPPTPPANWPTPKRLDTHLGVCVRLCVVILDIKALWAAVVPGDHAAMMSTAATYRQTQTASFFFLFPLASHCFITYLNFLCFFSFFLHSQLLYTHTHTARLKWKCQHERLKCQSRGQNDEPTEFGRTHKSSRDKENQDTKRWTANFLSRWDSSVAPWRVALKPYRN